ncbi:MAG: AmmeMemoRadiSam system protein B [Candidatus Aminicenantaceae bacterium]
MKRKPSVAGYFYPGNEHDLLTMVENMVKPEMKKEEAICVVSPHAGFIYSGPVAGAVFSSVQLPSTFVILGPSHRSISSLAAIMKEGFWETPLGEVSVDALLAELIMKHSSLITEDEFAHRDEHSLEVQLPFIQYFKKDISMVPICFSYEISYEKIEQLAKAVSQGIREFKSKVLIVASTDMSHYVNQKIAEKKDFLAIERVEKLDPKGLYDTVLREDISMCGFQPTTAGLIAAKELGAKKAELIKYQTSGDASGDYSQVVGYAGIRIS